MNSSPPKWCWSRSNHGLEASVMVTAVDWLLNEWSDAENQKVDLSYMLWTHPCPIIFHSLLKIQAMQRFLKSYSGIGGSVACIQCWKMNCFSREGKLHMQEKLVTNRAFAWKLEDLGIEREVKLVACERAEGEKKVREATDSLTVSWDAVWRRGILFPVAVIILQPHNLPLTLEKLFLDTFSPHRSPHRICVWNTNYSSNVLNVLRHKYRRW